MKYIYLFPDSGAMGNYRTECRKFGCEFLGKNRFQGERNLVIRGELSDLKRYAKWLDYELHPGYLYKENDFAGDISDACKDSKSYEYIDSDKVNEAELKSLCRANHVELTKLSGEYRLYGESDDIEYVLDSLGIELNDACKDAVVICPDMSLQEMKDYCEVYDVNVYAAGEKGKYRIEGREAKRVIEELKADGFIQDYLKDATMEQEEKLHDFLESQWTYLGNKGNEQVWQYTRPGYFPEKVKTLRSIAPDLISYVDMLDKKVYIKESMKYDSTQDSCKDDEIEGIYECKNNEVIEVRYDDKYKDYRFTFQKGGSPIILPKEEGKKLLRQYQAVKYQDSCKDSIYINGTLKDFNPRELVEKVKQRQENLHTNRIDKSGKVHSIFVNARGLVEKPSLIYIDIITQDIKGDNQERVLMKYCKDWEEAIQVMENYKRQHMNDSIQDEKKKWYNIYNKNKEFMNEFFGTEDEIKELMEEFYPDCYYEIAKPIKRDACKDETPYQKQYNGLQKELKKMDSIHKAIKAYNKFKKDSYLNDDEITSNLPKQPGQARYFQLIKPFGEYNFVKVECEKQWDPNKAEKEPVLFKMVGYTTRTSKDIFSGRSKNWTSSGWGFGQFKLYDIVKFLKEHNAKISSKSAMDSIKDAISLRKGDWFIKNITIRESGNIFRNIILYKVIDDKFQERNGFSPSLVAEEYVLDTLDIVYGKQNLNLKKQGTTTLSQRNIENITVFNSVEEAFKWLKTRIASIKSISEKLKEY